MRLFRLQLLSLYSIRLRANDSHTNAVITARLLLAIMWMMFLTTLVTFLLKIFGLSSIGFYIESLFGNNYFEVIALVVIMALVFLQKLLIQIHDREEQLSEINKTELITKHEKLLAFFPILLAIPFYLYLVVF